MNQARFRSIVGCDVFYYTASITEADIENGDGVVYLPEYDVLVGFSEYAEVPHPYSDEARKIQIGEYSERLPGSSVTLFCNDGTSDHRYNTLWWNPGYGVVPVVTQNDPGMLPGLYVTTSLRTFGEETEIKTVGPISENEFEKYAVYKNKTDAETYGKPEIRVKRLMDEERLRTARAQSEHKLAQEKELADLKLKDARRDSEMADFKARHDREMMELKYAYEDKLRKQKTTMDTFKFVLDMLKANWPYIVAGIAALYGLFRVKNA